jgi:hypothetical protein
MSRRHVAADEPGCTWEYGWDPQRQTFFAQLLAGEEPAQRPLARFGTGVRQVGSADALMYLMGIRLSAERIAVLEQDRLTDSEEVETPSGSLPALWRMRSGGNAPAATLARNA